MEVKHNGCFNCGGGLNQAVLESRPVKIVNSKGELIDVPRSVALCDSCANLKVIDMRLAKGR